MKKTNNDFKEITMDNPESGGIKLGHVRMTIFNHWFFICLRSFYLSNVISLEYWLILSGFIFIRSREEFIGQKQNCFGYE